MSKEYIEREALKAEFIGNPQDNYTPNLIKAIIDSQPAADVAEVVHGKWKNHRCNACGDVNPTITEDFYGDYISNQLNYCPRCGAKMDGGDTR